MKESEKRNLDHLMIEIHDDLTRLGNLKETGNSKGENKEFYRGKESGLRRVLIVLRNMYIWHGLELPLTIEDFNEE